MALQCCEVLQRLPACHAMPCPAMPWVLQPHSIRSIQQATLMKPSTLTPPTVHSSRIVSHLLKCAAAGSGTVRVSQPLPAIHKTYHQYVARCNGGGGHCSRARKLKRAVACRIPGQRRQTSLMAQGRYRGRCLGLGYRRCIGRHRRNSSNNSGRQRRGTACGSPQCPTAWPQHTILI